MKDLVTIQNVIDAAFAMRGIVQCTPITTSNRIG